MVLSDLCQTYDFSLALGSATVPITGAQGSGPYNLPTDYLRMAQNEVIYMIDGTPQVMVNVALWEFDAFIQEILEASYPRNFATNPATTPPTLFVWPPTSINVSLTIRYYKQMPEIATPETSVSVPWFDNQNYLITRVAGEIMKISNDARTSLYLGQTPDGAQGILTRYLKLEADDEGRAQTVQLDRRRFGRSWDRLANTKSVGW
jgi:hypothetical protein